MKKNTWLLSILLILCLTVSFTGCGETTKQNTSLSNESSSDSNLPEQPTQGAIKTIGNVHITLDEATVDPYGMYVTDASNRTLNNTYKLIPGHTYTKDPTLHVREDSDSAWLFVKIENQLSDIIEPLQLNGWQLLEGYDNFYTYTGVGNPPIAVAGGNDIVVFESFTVRSDASNDQFSQLQDRSILVEAFGIQSQGVSFEDAAKEATKHWDLRKKLPSGSNIQAGTLDMALNSDTQLFFISEKWEPGYVEYAADTLKNVGDLALKYRFSIANVQREGDANLADVLEVYVGTTAEDMVPANFLGTLQDLIDADSFDIKDNGFLLPGESKAVELMIHMVEEAGNEYMTAEITFDITITATQIPYEPDGFGNSTYDQNL